MFKVWKVCMKVYVGTEYRKGIFEERILRAKPAPSQRPAWVQTISSGQETAQA